MPLRLPPARSPESLSLGILSAYLVLLRGRGKKKRSFWSWSTEVTEMPSPCLDAYIMASGVTVLPTRRRKPPRLTVPTRISVHN